jgi:hypothetical protein
MIDQNDDKTPKPIQGQPPSHDSAELDTQFLQELLAKGKQESKDRPSVTIGKSKIFDPLPEHAVRRIAAAISYEHSTNLENKARKEFTVASRENNNKSKDDSEQQR